MQTASHVYFGLNAMWVSTALLAITYAAIMSEKVNRAIIALIGASVMVVVGVLDQEEAIKGNVSLLKLAKDCPQAVERLRIEFMVPTYSLDLRGRRKVESKDETKSRLPQGRSPDNADAFNLSFLKLAQVEERAAGRVRVAQ